MIDDGRGQVSPPLPLISQTIIALLVAVVMAHYVLGPAGMLSGPTLAIGVGLYFVALAVVAVSIEAIEWAANALAGWLSSAVRDDDRGQCGPGGYWVLGLCLGVVVSVSVIHHLVVREGQPMSMAVAILGTVIALLTGALFLLSFRDAPVERAR